MTWFKVGTAHDGMERGLIVELKDTADVKKRVAKGYLERTGEPAWSQRKRKASTTTPTGPSISPSTEPSVTFGGPSFESSDIGRSNSES